MPEEINRLVTDVLADVLWPPSEDGVENLLNEGIPRERILLVGNIMIDTLEVCRDRIERQDAFSAFGQSRGSYAVATIHRPSNVDDPVVLRELCGILERVSASVPLVFPVRPRTRQRIDADGLLAEAREARRLFLPDPMPYIAFMNLVLNARLVVTDSAASRKRPRTSDSLPDAAGEHRAARDGHARHQPAVQPGELLERVGEILSAAPGPAPASSSRDGRTAGRVVDAIRRQFGATLDLEGAAAAATHR